jgi:hypothetical protein
VLARPESPHIDFEWNFKSDKLLGQWFQKSFRPEGAAELAFAIKFKKVLYHSRVTTFQDQPEVRSWNYRISLKAF